jgi:membrane associated rhomboid family serine protease
MDPMDRLLARLERRFGKYAVGNLTAIIVAGMAAVFLLSMVRPDLVGLLTLDIDAVQHGQVWRLLSYLFLPRTFSLWWIIFSLGFVYYIGSSLESHWGSFQFNVYYAAGMLGTTAAAFLTHGEQTNYWLNLSLMLAFGTLFPEEEIWFFFIGIPAKWLAIADAAYMLYALVVGDIAQKAGIVAAMSGYLLFFTGTLIDILRRRNLQVRQAARRASSGPPAQVVAPRVCAICGASQEDGADIRVCTCEKCGGPRSLCLEHARNH